MPTWLPMFSFQLSSSKILPDSPLRIPSKKWTSCLCVTLPFPNFNPQSHTQSKLVVSCSLLCPFPHLSSLERRVQSSSKDYLKNCLTLNTLLRSPHGLRWQQCACEILGFISSLSEPFRGQGCASQAKSTGFPSWSLLLIEQLEPVVTSERVDTAWTSNFQVLLNPIGSY